jgi:hypothetical protein
MVLGGFRRGTDREGTGAPGRGGQGQPPERRPGLPRAASPVLVMSLALALAGPTAPPLAAAVPAPATTLALGGAWPLGTRQGLASPIVYLEHERGGLPGQGSLRAVLDTVVLTVAMRHRVAPAWSLGYGLEGTAAVVGYGADLYRNGVRLSAESYAGDGLAGEVVATLWPEGPWSGTLVVETSRARFYSTPETRPGYVPPPPLKQNTLRLQLARMGLLLGIGQAELTWQESRREDWAAWSLDPQSRGDRPHGRLLLRLEAALPAGGHDGGSPRGKGRLWAFDGHDLDLIDAYRVGGFAGSFQVAGYYRNEARASRGLVLNLEHERRFAEDRRLTVYADAASLTRLDAQILRGAPRTQALAGLGLGFYYGIRPLAGLPLIVRFGEGLLIPAGSPEGYRRELLVVLAAAF